MKQIGAFALCIAAALSGLPGLRPRITSPTFAAGRVGEPFAYRITASHQPGEFSASIPPPTGLQAARDSGWISGTPAVPGNFTVEVRARNAVGEGFQKIDLRIAPASRGNALPTQGTEGP